MHRITLNTEIQPMFFLPSQKLHLTWENPGPIDIDLSLCSEQERSWLRNAKIKKALFIENLNPEDKTLQEAVVTPTQKSAQKVNKAEELQAIKKQAEQQRIQKTDEAKKTLKAPMPALLRFIEKCTDPLQLRILSELEKNSKNRTKVIDALDLRLNAFSKTIGSIVGEPLDDSAFAKENNLPEIEEEVVDTVTIKFGAED